MPIARPVSVSLAPASPPASGDAEVGDERVAVVAGRMFSGLMSRWTTPCWWAYSRRRAASRAMRTASSIGSWFSRFEPGPERLAPTNGMVNQSWPAVVARVEDGEDVRVLEPTADPDLAPKALGAEGRRELGVQHLERDRAVVPEVLREVHRRHPAAPSSRSSV